MLSSRFVANRVMLTMIAAYLMPEPFDPYQQWLGIEPHEMPVDHYRLLGIQRFERDPAVIAAAADQRMSLVRTYQTGPRAPYTQKLLNELAAARVCLLNPGAKASYDQVLEAVFFTSTPPPLFAPVAVAPIQQPTVPSEEMVEEDDEVEEFVESSGSMVWAGIAGVVLVLLLATATALMYRQRVAERLAAEEDAWQQPKLVEAATGELTYEESKPVLIYQETNGSVNLDASFAQLHGPSIGLGISGNVNVIDAWESMDDWVSWTFKVVKVPPQGIFHVNVTYAARPEADGGSFVIAVGDQQKECEIRGTGAVVTDEYFIAVPNSGDHTLTVRAKSKPAQRLMTLKSVNLLFD